MKVAQKFAEKNEDRGFSILAALVAYLILGTALLATLELLVNSTLLGKAAASATKAAYVANSQLEELRVLPYTALLDSVKKYNGLYEKVDTLGLLVLKTRVGFSNLEAHALDLVAEVTYPVMGRKKTFNGE